MNYKVVIAFYFDYLNDNVLDVSYPCKVADIFKVYDLQIYEKSLYYTFKFFALVMNFTIKFNYFNCI